MISVCPVIDKKEVERIFSQKGFSFNEKSGVVEAREKEELLGSCLYELDERSITILLVEPTEDLFLGDGILRSALHVAAQRSAMDAFYAQTVNEDFLEKLAFIKCKEEKRLDIDKLFGGCGCKK